MASLLSSDRHRFYTTTRDYSSISFRMSSIGSPFLSKSNERATPKEKSSPHPPISVTQPPQMKFSGLKLCIPALRQVCLFRFVRLMTYWRRVNKFPFVMTMQYQCTEPMYLVVHNSINFTKFLHKNCVFSVENYIFRRMGVISRVKVPNGGRRAPTVSQRQGGRREVEF